MIHSTAQEKLQRLKSWRRDAEREKQQRESCVKNHICPDCGGDLRYRPDNWVDRVFLICAFVVAVVIFWYFHSILHNIFPDWTLYRRIAISPVFLFVSCIAFLFVATRGASGSNLQCKKCSKGYHKPEEYESLV
jgi:hypothetical protein